MVVRIVALPAALVLIGRLASQHGELLFHQSGGCCDGSTPMCFKPGELGLSSDDVLIGHIGGFPYYMHRSSFEFARNTQLLIDAVPGEGGAFSLENGTGLGFHASSRLFSDAELAELARQEGSSAA